MTEPGAQRYALQSELLEHPLVRPTRRWAKVPNRAGHKLLGA